MLKRSAVIGWEAKHRNVDLVIESPLKGEELLGRMKGWFTADVQKAVAVFRQHGRLKVLDEESLVVETPDMASMESLAAALADMFDREVWIEPIHRERLG